MEFDLDTKADCGKMKLTETDSFEKFQGQV